MHPLAITQLEEVAVRDNQPSKKDVVDIDQPSGQTAADILSNLYNHIGEHTWRSCIWDIRASDPNTIKVLSTMEEAKYEEAHSLLEKMMQNEKEKLASQSGKESLPRLVYQQHFTKLNPVIMKI